MRARHVGGLAPGADFAQQLVQIGLQRAGVRNLQGLVGVFEQAKGGADATIRTGSCSGSADWKLKAKHDSGVIETEFEVDSNRTGQTWRVPNELQPAVATSVGLPTVETQAFFVDVP